jgi:hypothetical protein
MMGAWLDGETWVSGGLVKAGVGVAWLKGGAWLMLGA